MFKYEHNINGLQIEKSRTSIQIKQLPAMGTPNSVPRPWNKRNSPKLLVSCSKPRYSTTKIDRREAKEAEKQGF